MIRTRFPQTYIYGLIDPRDHVCKYVGKADKPEFRYQEHLVEDYQSMKCNWVQFLVRSNTPPTLIILETVRKDCWQDRERHWIAKFRADGLPLVNGTDGGDGGRPTEEVRKRIGAASRQVWESDEYRERHRVAALQALNNGGRERISEAQRKRFEDPEQRANISQMLRESWVRRRKAGTASHSKTHSDNIRKALADPDVKARQSKNIRLAWKNPELKKRVGEKRRNMYKDPEFRQFFIERQKEVWASPERRKAMQEAARRGWENRKKRLQQGGV